MGNNNIKAIFSSANPKFYKEIIFQPFGRSLGYLSLLLLIVSLILSAQFAWKLKKGIEVFSREVIERLPEIIPQGIPPLRIEKGRVSSPVPQPFVIQKDNFAFVLDVTGKVTSLDQYKEGVLVTRDKIILKRDKEVGSEISEYDLNRMKFDLLDIKPGNKDKGEIINLTWGKKTFSVTSSGIARLANTAVLLILPFFLFLSFTSLLIGKLLQVIIFSLLSLVINNATAGRLKYRELINIGVYALTTPTVLSVVLILSTAGPGKQLLLRVWPIFYVIIYVIFLSLAIIKCKQDTEPQVLQD
jgi:hypothetical protein